MKNANETLGFLSEQIKSNQIRRADLKEKLQEVLNSKAYYQKVRDQREMLIETQVYLNDTEKQYTNDKARTIAVKSKLSVDGPFNSFQGNIDKYDEKINEIELLLRRNQIEIAFLERQYHIGLLTMGERLSA